MMTILNLFRLGTRVRLFGKCGNLPNAKVTLRFIPGCMLKVEILFAKPLPDLYQKIFITLVTLGHGETL